MLKILTNVDRQDVIHVYSRGQRFPKVEGKLVSVEASGRELNEFLSKHETPVVPNEGMVIAWHGKSAGRVLKAVRELFDAK